MRIEPCCADARAEDGRAADGRVAGGRTGSGRAGGRLVYGHVITKYSGMGRFTYPWCSAGGPRPPELPYKIPVAATKTLNC